MSETGSEICICNITQIINICYMFTSVQIFLHCAEMDIFNLTVLWKDYKTFFLFHVNWAT